MRENITEAELLEKVTLEEKAYNWVEAARLYKQVVEIYLDKKLFEKAALSYKRVGFLYSRAVETADSAEDFLKRSNNSINAYQDALNLFEKFENKGKELECKAEIFFIDGLTAGNSMEWKNAFNKSLELFQEASEHYSERDDHESTIRVLSRAAMTSFLLSQYIGEQKEIEEIYQKGKKITEKAWDLLKTNKNIQFLSEVIYSMGNLNIIPVYTTDFKKDKNYKEYLWKQNLMFDEVLTLLEDCEDYRGLALIYFAYGHVCCGYTCHFIEDERERGKTYDKGIVLFEKALLFSRKAKIKFLIIYALFWLNWWIFFGHKYNYVQKRILNDINEVVKIGQIYKNSNVAVHFFAYFLPVAYYANVANYSMFKPSIRKSYAEKGIEFAQECLKAHLLHPVVATSLYQMLTYSYSQLVNFALTENERNEQIQKMNQCARQANNIGEKLEGGLGRAAGYSSLYRAYKTHSDNTEDEKTRIKLLAAAAEILEKYMDHTIETVTASFSTELRLGLLFEEIGITTGKPKPLIKSRNLLLIVINEAIKRGYYHYVANGHEYVARIEDRLGNYLASAEHYEKAEESYSKSLKTIEYALLKKRIRTKRNYMNAWNLIELAKSYHKREEHLKAKDNYEKACQLLKKIPKYDYEAFYYNAWTYLEEAEQLGKHENHQESIKKYDETKENFNTAINRLENALKRSKETMEIERIKKLKEVAKVRINYCSARINIEEARILGKKGKHLSAAEKFSSAASQFKEICKVYKIEREKEELEAVYHLCRAWESMELAEQYENPDRYSEASHLFIKAGKLFTDSKMKLLSSGNSAFCQALEYGYKFDKSIEITIKAELYPKVKILLRDAANSYRKGNFESGADWALATSTYFDAAWHIIKADVEMTLSEKTKLLEVATKLLGSASELFEKAGYRYKQREVLDRLEMLQREDKILISALNTIKKPSISESTVGIMAPACPIETSLSPKLSDLERFKEEEIRFLEKRAKQKKIDKVKVFISYATTDSSYFQISRIAKKIIQYPEIEEILYWEEHLKDDIYRYMEKNVRLCDIFLLFCSTNALKSEPVQMEWQAALKIKKKIIPIFIREDDIPTLLSTKLGVQFNENDIEGTIKNIYDLILKKLEIY